MVSAGATRRHPVHRELGQRCAERARWWQTAQLDPALWVVGPGEGDVRAEPLVGLVVYVVVAVFGQLPYPGRVIGRGVGDDVG